MQRNICISCGYIVLKNALHDPDLCRDCEDVILDLNERYGFRDKEILIEDLWDDILGGGSILILSSIKIDFLIMVIENWTIYPSYITQ